MAIRTYPSDFQVTELLTAEAMHRLSQAASIPQPPSSSAPHPSTSTSRDGPDTPASASTPHAAATSSASLPPAARPSRPLTFHQWWRLDKVSLSTPEAIDRFARALKIPPSSVAYVGLKDKHAQTSQYISTPIAFKDLATPPPSAVGSKSESTQAPKPPPPDDDADSAPLAAGTSSWSATPLARLSESLAAHHVAGNAFTITIRRLSLHDLKTIDHRLQTLTHLDGSARFTNYFGAQRFGSARHGEGFAAPLLIQGDYLGGLKLLLASPARKDSGPWRSFTRIAAEHWPKNQQLPAKELSLQFKSLISKLPNLPEKRALQALAQGQSPRDAFGELPAFLQTMCVEAYQSWLWNEAARRTIHASASTPTRVLVADHDEFTPMAFAPASDLPDELVSLLAPLPSPTLAEPPSPPDNSFLRHLHDVLTEQGHAATALKLPGLRRPAFIENTRALICTAIDLSCTKHLDAAATSSDATAKPHHAVLTFSLPRGSYATVLLRALGQ